MTGHNQHMKRCLELARRGKGWVAPNPMVGCVITHGNNVIAEGWHRQYGGPHAEVDAITHCTHPELLKEATLYVNLEPCSHHGKTPPCADLIIEKQIANVVIGCQDPNPLVAGRGIEKLIRNGINVTVGVEEEACTFFNRRFITYMKYHRPYVILKWAQSADGFIDHVRSDENPGPAGISCEDSLKLSHQWRADEAAILIGTNTVLTDDPRLTVRHVNGTNPVRVTFDRRDRIPATAKILDGSAPTIVFNAEKNYTSEWAEYVRVDFDANPIQQALAELHERRLQSVLVEGGAAILKEFITSGQWDEARVFYSADNLIQGVAAPEFAFPSDREIQSGKDVVKIFYRHAE